MSKHEQIKVIAYFECVFETHVFGDAPHVIERRAGGRARKLRVLRKADLRTKTKTKTNKIIQKNVNIFKSYQKINTLNTEKHVGSVL